MSGWAQPELIAAMGKFNEEMLKAGVMLAAEGLHPSSKGARIKFSGGKRTVTDGSFTEAKELVAGFWLIQVKSKEEAIEWAKRCPDLLGEGMEAEIEVRQVFEASDFPPEIFPPEDAAREQALREELQKKAAKPYSRARLGSHWRIEHGLIGRRDDFRYTSHDRRGLEERRPRARTTENHNHRRSHEERRVMRLGINKEDVGRVREMGAAELFFDPVLSGASASPEDYLALMESLRKLA
jgi:hypothetical protein